MPEDSPSTSVFERGGTDTFAAHTNPDQAVRPMDFFSHDQAGPTIGAEQSSPSNSMGNLGQIPPTNVDNGLAIQPGSDQPTPVVKVLSVRGVEYLMMTITLWFVAIAVVWTLLSFVDGYSGFAVLSFPISSLIVCLPIFTFFFLRLRKIELANPAQRFDASKRRMSQITQVITFLISLTSAIGFVYLIVTKIAGNSTVSIFKAFLNLLVVLLVAGGILAYYWFDEHRLKNR